MYAMVLALVPLIGVPLYLIADGDRRRAADEAKLAVQPALVAEPAPVMEAVPELPTRPLATAV